MTKKTQKSDFIHPDIQSLIEGYEKLSPKRKAVLRHELLKRAKDDEAERRSESAARADAFAVARNAPAKQELFSDQLVGYLNILRDALKSYIPFDRYRDGDDSNMELIRADTLHALEPLEWLLKKYFRYEAHGLENVPTQGRAMIISNHGLLPVDGWFLFYEVYRVTGRWPRGLTDWRVYRLPWMRQLFMDMGMLVGSHQNGDKLLQREEMIYIMPGGSKEAWKSSKYRYRLLWQGRSGFIKMALRNSCPIIPSANVGTDDTYHVFFDGYTTAYKLFKTKKALFPISIPLGLGVLPRPVKMTQYVGELVRLPYPPEAEQDPAIVNECLELVKSKVYELIDLGLREREERSLSGILLR
jgi:1-acyl-sn-glycerol-3-phosphate acyltransferase